VAGCELAEGTPAEAAGGCSTSRSARIRIRVLRRARALREGRAVESPRLRSPGMPTPADQRIGMVLKRAEQALLRAKSAALKPAGLTLAQYVALDRQPGITGATLARASLVTPQAIMVVSQVT
jgi:hypothetical protein